MHIDPSWKYNEVIQNLTALKTQYKEILTSFSYTRDRNCFIQNTKKQIYSLKFNETKKDEIWIEMNNTGEDEIYEKDFEFND